MGFVTLASYQGSWSEPTGLPLAPKPGHHEGVHRIVVGALFFTSVGVAVAAAQGANVAPACVTVRAEPVLGAYGTNHVVVVINRCDVAVTCEVATDVDPEPRYRLRVAPGTEASVATRAESPASAFRPIYTCELP
ncbi:MAG: hypothetical protein H5U40_08095 [Polyangiaceae bacterium]|nr:hypothetical protein [Polyangiaceae bacterium]